MSIFGKSGFKRENVHINRKEMKHACSDNENVKNEMEVLFLFADSVKNCAERIDNTARKNKISTVHNAVCLKDGNNIKSGKQH